MTPSKGERHRPLKRLERSERVSMRTAFAAVALATGFLSGFAAVPRPGEAGAPAAVPLGLVSPAAFSTAAVNPTPGDAAQQVAMLEADAAVMAAADAAAAKQVSDAIDAALAEPAPVAEAEPEESVAAADSVPSEPAVAVASDGSFTVLPARMISLR